MNTAATAEPVDNASAMLFLETPFADVIKAIKRSRSVHLFIFVGTFASFNVQNPAKPTLDGTVGSGCIQISKVQLLEFLDRAFPEHWRPKLMLRVARSRSCLFVGSSPV